MSHRFSAGTVGFRDLDEKGPEGLNGHPDAISPVVVFCGSRIQNIPRREELGKELDPFEKTSLRIFLKCAILTIRSLLSF